MYGTQPGLRECNVCCDLDEAKSMSKNLANSHCARQEIPVTMCEPGHSHRNLPLVHEPSQLNRALQPCFYKPCFVVCYPICSVPPRRSLFSGLSD
jgi:hypothetical protein